MYYAILTINGKSINCAPDYAGNGCYIKTITGLTGVTSKLQTAQHATGYGEAYTGATVSGQTIRIDGYILNDDTMGRLMRKALIDGIIPKGTGTLTLYHVVNSDNQTELSIDVVVSQTPTITQEKRAKFSFTLYAPRPVWYASSASAVTVQQGTTENINVIGQVDADYTAQIVSLTETLTSITLTLDGGTRNAKSISLDLTKYSPGGVASGNFIYIRRVDGRLRVQVNTSDAMRALDVTSTFWYLPVGTHTLELITNANSAAATVAYKAGYAGVIVSGT